MRAVVAAALLVSVGLAGCLGGQSTDTPAADPMDAEPSVLPDGFSWNHVPDGTFEIGEGGSRLLEPGRYEVLDPEVFHVESPLGGSPTELIVVRPDVPPGTKVPVILTSTPYAVPLDADFLLNSKTYQRFGEQMVPHGYAYALHAARGYGGSGGCSDLLGDDEAADLDAAISWLGTQDWSTGDIGLIGISYDGGTAWLAAALDNPHVRTVVPIAGISDFFQMAYRNGTAGIYGQRAREVTSYHVDFPTQTARPLVDVSPEHWAEHVACPNFAEAANAQMYSWATGERDPGGFWEERDRHAAIAESYDGSIFVVHAFNDWNTAISQALPWSADLDVPTKLWFGWWEHEVPGDPDPGGCPDSCVPTELVRWDWAEVLKNWFDRWLLHDTTVDLGPPVQVADVHGQWRSDATWPPANATETTFHLGAGGALAAAPEDAAPGTAEVVDPRFTCSWCLSDVYDLANPVLDDVPCLTCPTFTTEPLPEPLYVSGMPRVHVMVIPTGPAGVLSATLSMTVDGETTPFGWGVIDLRFADGGEVGAPVVPGEPLLVRLALDPTEAHVPAGAEISLTLHQSGYGQWLPSTQSPPTQVVLGDGASMLMLDTFEPAADRLFDPPQGSLDK